jgi:hypothetical protein
VKKNKMMMQGRETLGLRRKPTAPNGLASSETIDTTSASERGSARTVEGNDSVHELKQKTKAPC